MCIMINATSFAMILKDEGQKWYWGQLKLLYYILTQTCCARTNMINCHHHTVLTLLSSSPSPFLSSPNGLVLVAQPYENMPQCLLLVNSKRVQHPSDRFQLWWSNWSLEFPIHEISIKMYQHKKKIHKNHAKKLKQVDS